ncbi:hypothetical protein GSH05_27310 [Burkholderia pseudomallei]|uniref:hypothetical protein n=2 Tax=Pseudomonadota TaxID=1224 RepID=UPI000536B8CD|nr:hypothetical protein [Burkholderia pseudomallei]KGX47685.1 hypothetical protein Y043_6073 [Burkholderia pseudomallei MSHR2138]MBM5655229.1 hypothetical protein [Burkholderia pseudomallei]
MRTGKAFSLSKLTKKYAFWIFLGGCRYANLAALAVAFRLFRTLWIQAGRPLLSTMATSVQVIFDMKMIVS